MSLSDEAKLEVQARFSEATRLGDADAVAALAAPDATVWHNFDDASITVEQSGRTLRHLHGVVVDLEWDDVAVEVTTGGFLWRAVITGRAPGGPLRVHTCMAVTLNDGGAVLRIDEYLDPAGFAVLASLDNDPRRRDGR